MSFVQVARATECERQQWVKDLSHCSSTAVGFAAGGTDPDAGTVADTDVVVDCSIAVVVAIVALGDGCGVVEHRYIENVHRTALDHVANDAADVLTVTGRAPWRVPVLATDARGWSDMMQRCWRERLFQQR